jgi:uncharacterized membrane protein
MSPARKSPSRSKPDNGSASSLMKRFEMNGQVERAAIHEAAHAVVAHCLMVPFLRVEIGQKGRSVGRLVYDRRRRAKLSDLVLIDLAGYAAELRLFGAAKVNLGDAQYASDVALVNQHMNTAVFTLAERLDRTREIVKIFWREIQAVADELIDERVLSHRRVGEIRDETKKATKMTPAEEARS